LHCSTDKDFIKASSYLEENKLKKALNIFLKIYKRGSVDSGLNIGYIYEKMDQRKKAKKIYKELIRKQKDTSAMINLAILYKEKSNIKKAKKYLKKASKLDDGDASFELAKIYLCEARIKKSIKYFYVTIDSQNVCEENIELAKKYISKINNYCNKI